LRPAVSRPVRLAVGRPLWPMTMTSLTRGWVFNLQCNHSLVRVAQDPQPYFTVSYEAPPTWRARSPYLYPPGTGWPSYTSGHWVPFSSPLATRRATAKVSTPPRGVRLSLLAYLKIISHRPICLYVYPHNVARQPLVNTFPRQIVYEAKKSSLTCLFLRASCGITGVSIGLSAHHLPLTGNGSLDTFPCSSC
jgi:hypothetical protein